MKTKEQMIKELREESMKRMRWTGWFDDKDILKLMEEYATQQINNLTIPIVSNLICPNCGEDDVLRITTGLMQANCSRCYHIWQI